MKTNERTGQVLTGTFRMTDLVIPGLVFIDGLALVLAAIFAHELRLDADTTWGGARVILLFLGLILISIAAFFNYSLHKRNTFFAPRLTSETVKVLFSLAHIWVIVCVVYIWFITYGTWTTWNHTTGYYDLLAKAFDRGQLNVDINPGPALLSVPNPYDPAYRPFFNGDIWDMSLYKGKLYLYWGPVPALLIAPLKLFIQSKITDNYLVFAFLAGLLVFDSLILVKLRKNIFPKIPAWHIFPAVLLVGLAAPILWSVSSPRVYEAAVASGQLFLMGGIYFVLSALDQAGKIGKVQLFLAGLCWVCSVGSRAMDALMVIFLAGLVVLWLARSGGGPISRRNLIEGIGALMLPLIIGALAIAGYNWARFDSPLEFGLRYQITILDINRQGGLLFLPRYFFPNFYVYLLRPFEVAAKFPFLYPTTPGDLIELHRSSSGIYFAGRMTGLLFCAPFLVFSLVHLHRGLPQKHKAAGSAFSYNLVTLLLAGTFVIGFLSLAFFYFGQMRYLLDVISPLAILAVLGYWKMIAAWQGSNPIRYNLLRGFANLLIVATICASVLLAFSGDYDRFKSLNPVLFERIAGLLTLR